MRCYLHLWWYFCWTPPNNTLSGPIKNQFFQLAILVSLPTLPQCWKPQLANLAWSSNQQQEAERKVSLFEKIHFSTSFKLFEFDFSSGQALGQVVDQVVGQDQGRGQAAATTTRTALLWITDSWPIVLGGFMWRSALGAAPRAKTSETCHFQLFLLLTFQRWPSITEPPWKI